MKHIVKDLEKLRDCSEPVTLFLENGARNPENDEIIAQLTHYLENHKNTAAIAAPQIGIKSRIFCIRFSDGIKAFINPIITKKNRANNKSRAVYKFTG